MRSDGELFDIHIALRKLHTDNARIRLLELAHKKGMTKASKLLLRIYQNSDDPITLEKAAQIALKLGERDKAIILLVEASEGFLREGFIINAYQCAKDLKKIDIERANSLYNRIFKFCETLACQGKLNYGRLAVFVELWGDSRNSLEYWRKELHDLLNREYLSPDCVLRIVDLYEQFGELKKAKKLAKDYIFDWIAQGLPLNVDGLDLDILDEGSIVSARGYGSMLELCAKIGPVDEVIMPLIKKGKLLSAAKLAEKVGYYSLFLGLLKLKAMNAIERGRYEYALNLFKRGNFNVEKIRDQLLALEAEKIIKELGEKVLYEYDDFFNMLRLLGNKRAKAVIDTDEIYSLAQQTNVLELIRFLKNINDSELREKLLSSAIKRFRDLKLYNCAALLVTHLKGKKQAEKFWKLASREFEKLASIEPSRYKTYIRAALLASEDAGEPKRVERLLKNYYYTTYKQKVHYRI